MSNSEIARPNHGSSSARARSNSKTYEGKRQNHVVLVTVNGRPLDSRLDLWNHSETGFEWGYGGSGPAQLALALLADHLSDDDEAVRLHQGFKFAVVAKLPHAGWTLASVQIAEALYSLRDRAVPASTP